MVKHWICNPEFPVRSWVWPQNGSKVTIGWLRRLVNPQPRQGVGSIPTTPTICGIGVTGGTSACQAEGFRGFESLIPHKLFRLSSFTKTKETKRNEIINCPLVELV